MTVLVALATILVLCAAVVVSVFLIAYGKKRGGLIFLSVIVAFIGANYALLIDTHAKQDDCAFGPVSNDQYRQYLSLAKARIQTRSASDFESELSRVFRETSGSETSIYSRLAIMHATLRALGAEYRNTNGFDVDQGRSDPYLNAITQKPYVSYQYVLDVNRLRVFLPWPRVAWIIGVLAGPRYEKPPGPLYPKKRGGLAFIVHWPNLEDVDRDAKVKSSGSCPPAPNKDLAESFSFTPD